MSSYRVLMVAPTSFFSDYGCHVRILEEARVLRERGHCVSICTYRKGRDIDGFPIYRTLPLPWRQHYEVGSSRHKFAYDALLAPLVLVRALRQRPHVIHAHLHEGALIGGVVGRLLRVPLVFDLQGSMTNEMVDHHFLRPDGPWYRPARWLERRINGLPQTIITSSRHTAKLLQEEFGCDKARITAIPDCVNTSAFRPGVITPEERRTIRQQLGIPPEARVVVYLGLLAEYHGTNLLLHAATHVVESVPDAHFLVMGFPGVNEYRAYAHSIGLRGRVTFTGKIPYEEAPRYLALGDVAVAPKISDTEGAGKLLNYMAMALPTVAFPTAVNREYLGDLGIYAESVDERSLASALVRSLESLDSMQGAGLALRRRAKEHFSWDMAAAQIEAIYAGLRHGAASSTALSRSCLEK